jgi:hypothetical protein
VISIERYPKLLTIPVNYVALSEAAGAAIPVEKESALIQTLALPT